MKYRHAYLIFASLLIVATSVPADIVWSGEQNLSDFEQYIDLNSDSLVDVILAYNIVANNSIPPEGYDGFLDVSADGYGVDGSNRILVDSSSGFDAALPLGILISGSPVPSLEWAGGRYFSGRVSEWSTFPPTPDTEWSGPLGANGNTYVGISFDVGDSTHYGWINIGLGEVGSHGFRMPVTTSWAYESAPDTGIIAGAVPEPSTGILTVVGSLSLLLLTRSRRRRERVSRRKSPTPLREPIRCLSATRELW